MKISRREKTASPAERPSEAELFTDREEFIDAFWDGLNSLTDVHPKVLVFHGTSGIGKSEIKKELIRQLMKKRGGVTAHDGAPIEDNDDYRTIWAGIDFNSPEYRTPDRGLLKLRNDMLHDRVWQIPFRTFDIGFAIRWRKTNSELPLNLETLPGLNDSRIIKDVLELGGEIFPGVKLVARLTRIMKTATGELKDWWTVRKSETLQQLEEAEPYEIDKALPGLFADDLLYFLTREKVRLVIFFDAYEKLWETEADRSPHRYHAVDAWVRDLVAAAPGALLVITGHDDVRWCEVRDEEIKWDEVVTNEHVESLTQSDCYTLLERAGITDESIKEKIYRGSHGVPLYIDLSIDTYYDVVRKGEQPGPDDFGGTYEEIFNRFFERLSREEAVTLEVIGPARSFDTRLFEAVVNHFGTGFPTAAFGDFVRFSFVTEEGENDAYRIHDLLRDHIKAYTSEEKWREAQTFMFEYYRERAEVERTGAITQGNLSALSEAVYYGLALNDVDEKAVWFTLAATAYRDRGFYMELEKLYLPVIEKVGYKYGPEDVRIAPLLNNLGYIYEQLGNYSKAEPLLKKALEINEREFGAGHLKLAATLDNLAGLYEDTGRNIEALPLYNRSLAIKEKFLGVNHISVAITLNNLGWSYKQEGNYSTAEALFQRSIHICRTSLGPENEKCAAAINNLAMLYEEQGAPLKAEPLYLEALQLVTNTFGPEHPNVGYTLNNLGAVYVKTGRYEEAVDNLERALSILVKFFPEEHPKIITILGNLEVTYFNLGLPEKAAEYGRRAEVLKKSREDEK